MNEDRFDLRQLDAFAAVMSAGSITGAARLLGRSQPAVTRLIQDLEAALGFTILRRSGPRVSPTERGIQFYEEVERLLQSFRHSREVAQAIARSAPRPLSIAATPALCVGLVPGALAALEADLLPGRIHVSAVAAERVVQEVVSRSADLGLATLPFEESGIDVHWVGEAPCVAVMRADHPLAARAVVRLRDLRGYRLLTLASRLRQRIDAVLARAHIEIEAIFQSNASATVLAMAREGLGIGVVEPASAHGLPLEGLAIRPLDTFIPSVVGAFSPAGKPMSPTVVALNEALLAQASAVLSGFRLTSGGSQLLAAGALP